MAEIRRGSQFILTQSEAMIVLACSERGGNLTDTQLAKLDAVKERALQVGLGPGDVLDLALLAHEAFPGAVFELKPSKKS